MKLFWEDTLSVSNGRVLEVNIILFFKLKDLRNPSIFDSKFDPSKDYFTDVIPKWTTINYMVTDSKVVLTCTKSKEFETEID